MKPQRVPILVLPLVSIILAVTLAAAGALFMSVRSAHAEIEGPCDATIAGVDVAGVNSGSRSDDIHVSRHDAVPVSASSPAGFRSHKIQLEFASRRWTVSEQEDDGSTQWSDTVNVDDYATYGVGLYKVVGVSVLSDGTTCTGAATVDVDGNPLATVAGAAAAGAAALGTVAAVGSGLYAAAGGNPRPAAPAEEFVNMMQETDEAERERRWRERQREIATRPETPNSAFLIWLFGCWSLAFVAALMMPLLALTGGGAGGAAPGGPQAPAAGPSQPQRLPRAMWLPRITLLGLISGLLAGAGIVVLLQQYSVMYPTLTGILVWVILGMVVYGLLLPTLGYTVRWLRVNRRVAELERSMGIG